MTETPTQRANARLRTIWMDALDRGAWPSGIAKMWPLQYHAMEPRRLLFIGLNPSDSGDSKLLALRSPHADDLKSTERAHAVLHRDECAMGLHGRKLHRYFRQFPRFMEDGTWNHVDLLAARHTNQSEVSGALALGTQEAFASTFVAAQLGVCLELAAALAPPAVVVVNALAATLLKWHLKPTQI